MAIKLVLVNITLMGYTGWPHLLIYHNRFFLCGEGFAKGNLKGRVALCTPLRLWGSCLCRGEAQPALKGARVVFGGECVFIRAI